METGKIINPIHPDVIDKLDPAFIKLYNEHLAHIPPRAPDLAVLRKIYSTQFSYATAPSPKCAEEYEDEIDGWERYPAKIKIRVYKPHGTPPSRGWPVHIDFHGGGWGLGDLETEAHILRHICVNASVAVIDVDYRLIPEYPFPTAIYDSFEALRMTALSPDFASKHNIDASSISLGGLSAGANIALILNHLARDHTPSPIPIKAVIAGTPVIADLPKPKTDPPTDPKPQDSPFLSMTEMEHAPTLNWMRLRWFDNLKTKSMEQPTAVSSPQRDTDSAAQHVKDVSWFLDALTAPNFKNLADLTYIATAGCDPLRDEGEEYGRRVMEASNRAGGGNKVIVKRFSGVPHPFQHMDGVLVEAQKFIADACQYVREAHYGV